MTTNTLRDLSESSSYWNISNPIGAKSDVDVVKAWIQHSCSNSQHTLNSYVKEIKRFLIFCDSIQTRFDHISALDINQYLAILHNPDDTWLKPENGSVTLKTQILLKALKLDSVEYTQRVLNSFYNYIKEAGVIKSNPVLLSTKIRSESAYSTTGKALSFDAWDYLSAWLKHESLKANNNHNRSKAIRDRWLMHLLYCTGARRSSITNMNMASFSVEQTAHKRVWVVNFLMKGNRKHSVLVTDELLEEFLKRASSDCEDYFISKELEAATPHTFRHTCATHWLTLGIDIVATQKHLGHKNINTTMIYMRDSDEHRINENERLSKIMADREKKYK